MGTRADFYFAKTKDAEKKWLGSIAWDGYEIGDVANAKNKRQYLNKLKKFLSQRDDSTLPENGWPWPWKNSKLTDRCYIFIEENNTLYQKYHTNGKYDDHTTPCDFCPINIKPYNDEGEMKKIIKGKIQMTVPSMEHLANNPPVGSKQSGIIVITGPR